MKFACTFIKNNLEIVAAVLPLDQVPEWKPAEPLPNTYHVQDDVQVGWIKQANGDFLAPPPPTQLELDTYRYAKRAAAKDGLIAWMAADNMTRVRKGMWSVADLTGLMSDPEIKALLDLVNTLSFELAANHMETIKNSLLTTEIKSAWKAKLQSHFYLQG